MLAELPLRFEYVVVADHYQRSVVVVETVIAVVDNTYRDMAVRASSPQQSAVEDAAVEDEGSVVDVAVADVVVGDVDNAW